MPWFGWGAADDDLCGVVGDLGEGGGFGCGGFVVEGEGEFVVAGAEVCGFGARLGEPVGEEIVVDGAVFECD